MKCSRCQMHVYLWPSYNYCFAETPPSTIMTVPVTHLASSEQRYATAPAMSSGSPILRRGNPDSNTFLAFSSCKYGSIIELFIVEGHTQLHRKPYWPYSTAIPFVNMITPAFVTPYTVNGTLGIERTPSTEEILTMLPPPFFIMTGIVAFVILNVPKILVSTSPS